MTTVTIGTIETRSDSFYRYQRDLVMIQYMKRKTKITNLDRISLQLNCTSQDITKWISKKIGARVENGWFVGVYMKEQLEDLLQNFIEKIILCKICHLPELDGGKCKSCGNKPGKTEVKPDSKPEIQPEEPTIIEREQAELLRLLYDLRDQQKDPVIDEAIDAIWSCDKTVSWVKLQVKLLDFVKEISSK